MSAPEQASGVATPESDRPELLAFASLLDKERRHVGAKRASPGTSSTPSAASAAVGFGGTPAATAGAAPAPEVAPGISAKLDAREPWVQFTKEDYFGLALSGGGIRSAVFNLGLLQSLGDRGILNAVQYLSTVSGGGYIGGFWTNWLRRKRKESDGPTTPIFPSPGGKDPNHFDPREPDEIRHLREYSRFIIPRVGFGEFETWNAIITILGGMIPSVLTSVALIGLIFETAHLWARNIIWNPDHPVLGSACFAIAVTVMQGVLLWDWAKTDRSKTVHPLEILAATAATTVGVWLGLQFFVPPSYSTWTVSAINPSWKAPNVDLYLRVFYPGAALVIAALVIIAVRFIVSESPKKASDSTWSPSLDRAAAVCLSHGLAVLLLGAIWELGRYLASSGTLWQIPYAAGGTSLFGALLFGLRNWLSKRVVDTSNTGAFKSLTANLKPFIPQLLSAAIFLGLVFTTVLVLQLPIAERHPQRTLAVGVAIITVALLCFNPQLVGMHDFYRRRIRDCFLAASWSGAKDSAEDRTDDPTLGELREEALANGTLPLHLICCTANNLAGDTLTNLYRGARSAVISPYGISLGGQTASLKELRLSSALTASAAAFNSQMGQLSVNWGPAVAFAMSTFSLRLGLWVPHPGNSNPRRFHRFPGLAFFYELMGITYCDPSEDMPSTGARGKDNYLHLSDGGHFENLALYELIRRHCRYIIVSDCGADEDIKFDDLANAIRRVREDFGVQIEIDVSPLRPGPDGLSRQHAVVGTIHYDTLNGMDKGTLLYIKPTLTGDEPADVLQHHSRYPHFPHDSTAEQLYNEAQWESYRHLGEHVGRTVFAFLDKGKASGEQFVENLFFDAGAVWRPVLAHQDELYSELTERCSIVETDLRLHGPLSLKLEFFPEIAATLPPLTTAERETLAAGRGPEELTQIAYFLMLVLQIMEDVWVAADLDRNWSHPMVQGWMSYLQRWSSTPSFRTWWPILRPMYNPGFREFVKVRCNLRVLDSVARTSDSGLHGPTLNLHSHDLTRTARQGMAYTQWELIRGERPDVDTRLSLSYWLTLVGGSKPMNPIEVGLLLYSAEATAEGMIVRWHFEDLFVPPALNGAGFTGRFLDRLIMHFKTARVQTIEVTISRQASQKLPNRAGRWALVEAITFYKSRGFSYEVEPPVMDEGQSQETILVLHPQSTKPTGTAL